MRGRLAAAFVVLVALTAWPVAVAGAPLACPSPSAPIPMYYLVFQCGIAALGTTATVDFPCNTYCEPILHHRDAPSGTLIATTASGAPFVECEWIDGQGGCDVWNVLELTSERIDATLTMTGGDGLIVIQWQSF